jgi:glycosyltransferase involved in cell wall biosynthesis
LNRLGCESTLFVLQAQSSDPGVLTFHGREEALLKRLRWRLRALYIGRDFAQHESSRPAGYERFSDDRSVYGADLFKRLPSSDVINVHWIAGFVDYLTFFTTAPAAIPIVWTLHDMNAFTGGCHYNLGCSRYTDSCGACPQLGSSTSMDLSRQVWQRKKRAFAQVPTQRMRIVTPSRWLAHEVQSSTLGKSFAVSVIPYGVDTERFAPRNRASARDALGIPRGAAVVLFLADAINIRRKGFALLAQALAGLEVPNLFLLSAGRGMTPMDLKAPRLHLGAIDNDRLLSIVYNAADLFAIPSLQDNLPNTVLESLACGTPVVGFNVGGIPDMVRPNVTGLLAMAEDVTSLRGAISELLRDRLRRTTMAAHCRRIALKEYALDVQAQRYVELYQSILQREATEALTERRSAVSGILKEDEGSLPAARGRGGSYSRNCC